MRVAAGHQDASVCEQVGSGVVHARDSCGRHGVESRAGVVGGVCDGSEDCVAGLAPSLGTLPRTVDDEHVARGQQHHVAHGAPHRHGLHDPRGRRGRHVHAPACLRRRPGQAVFGGVSAQLSAPAYQHLGCGEAGGMVQGQQHGRSSGRVVARLPGDGGERLDYRVGGVVQQDGIAVGEDEEVATGQQVHERVQIVVLTVVRGDRVGEQLQVERALRGAALGYKLVAVGAAPAHHNLALAVGEELVGRVPAAICERGRFILHPVAGAVGLARHEAADLVQSIVVATSLHHGAVGEELARRAPCVGLHPESAHRVGLGVHHNRVRGAVTVCIFRRIHPALAIGQRDVGGADFRAVEHDGSVVVRDSRVHRCNSGILDEQLPGALCGGSRDQRNLNLKHDGHYQRQQPHGLHRSRHFNANVAPTVQLRNCYN